MFLNIGFEFNAAMCQVIQIRQADVEPPYIMKFYDDHTNTLRIMFV